MGTKESGTKIPCKQQVIIQLIMVIELKIVVLRKYFVVAFIDRYIYIHLYVHIYRHIHLHV